MYYVQSQRSIHHDFHSSGELVSTSFTQVLVNVNIPLLANKKNQTKGESKTFGM